MMGNQREFTWKVKGGNEVRVSEMTDAHIRNAWAFMFRSNFAISDWQLKAFEAFRTELKHRHKWNLKLQIQYRDLNTRNLIHHTLEEIMCDAVHEYDYM